MNSPLSISSSHDASDGGGNRVDELQNEFLKLLDDKMMRVNHRRWSRLQAWAGVLDAAGWCVTLPTQEGGIWLSPNARQNLQDEAYPPSGRHAGGGVYIWPGDSSGQEIPDPLAELTVREREVFDWLRAGKSDAEISVILGCSVRTVEKHVSNLYQKLGVKSRVEAILNSAQAAS